MRLFIEGMGIVAALAAIGAALMFYFALMVNLIDAGNKWGFVMLIAFALVGGGLLNVAMMS